MSRLVVGILIVLGLFGTASAQSTGGEMAPPSWVTDPDSIKPDTGEKESVDPEEDGQGGGVTNVGPAETTIKAYFEPEGDIYVGQTVRLWLEILTTGSFKKAPVYPELKVDGAIALLPEQFGVNYSSTESGKSLTGQRQRYAIVPIQGGTLNIPALTVPLSVAGSDGTEETISLTTEPMQLDPVPQPGAEDLGYLVSVEGLKVSESYKQAGGDLKVGDAIERIVEISADGTFGLALPVVTFDAVDGTQIYPKEPVLTDKINRGTYKASRRDSATYVFETEGTVVLPEISVSWFDLASKTVKTEVLEMKELRIAANPAFSEAGGDQTPVAGVGSDLDRIRQIVLIGLQWVQNYRWQILSVLMVAGGLYYIWRETHEQVARHIQARRQAHLNSERYAFHLFSKACVRDDAREMQRLFWIWVSKALPGTELPTQRDLRRLVPESEFLGFVGTLSETRFSESGSAARQPTGRTVLQQARKFRSELLAALEPVSGTDQSFLNPRPPAVTS